MFKASRSKSLKAPGAPSAKANRAPSASFSRDGFNNTSLKGKDNFYESAVWKSLRQQVLIRDMYKCVLCSSTDRLDVHHIRSRTRGGADVLANLQTLCHACHEMAHGRKIHRR